MARTIFLFLLLSSIFIFGSILFEKNGVISWVASLVIYLIGLQWVIPFLLKETMYTHYIAHPLKANDPKSRLLRFLHFLIGLSLCIFSTIL